MTRGEPKPMRRSRDDYYRLQQLLNTDLPYIHLWYFDNVAVVDRRLTGMTLQPGGDYDFLKSVRVTRAQQ